MFGLGSDVRRGRSPGTRTPGFGYPEGEIRASEMDPESAVSVIPGPRVERTTPSTSRKTNDGLKADAHERLHRRGSSPFSVEAEKAGNSYDFFNLTAGFNFYDNLSYFYNKTRTNPRLVDYDLSGVLSYLTVSPLVKLRSDTK